MIFGVASLPGRRTIALLVVPTTLAAGREATASLESAESVGLVDVDGRKK